MTFRRSIIVVALLVVVVALGMWLRAVRVTRRLLRVDAPASIAEKSGNVYQVAVGRVQVNPIKGRVTVDTIHVTTNDAANAARPHPRAGLKLSFRDCTLSGVHVFTLIFRRGLVADTFGCSAVTAAVDVPRASPPDPLSRSLRSGQAVPERGNANAVPKAGNAHAAERGFFALQQSLRLPASAPQVRVTRIDFPQVALDLALRHAGGEARLQLKQLRWLMSDFLIDPRDSTAAARPLFSDSLEIQAADFVGQLDSVTAVTVKRLRLSLSDSTLAIRGVAFAPRQSDAAFARSHRYRGTLIRTAAARIDARGLDVGVFLLRQGLRARTVRLDSLRLDVLSDQRGPESGRKSRTRMPQAWIAGIERGIQVDSVVIRGGEIVYREHKPRHPAPGVLKWGRLSAIATNVRHVAGRRSTRDRMTLKTTSWFQNAGKFNVQFVVPLDAPRFTMTFQGKLGAMPATRLNEFLEQAMPGRLDKGQVESITFKAQVTNGVAHGTVVPLYKDLAMKVTGAGAKGIVGKSGAVGNAARSVATVVGNQTQLRSDNPDDGATAPRTGPIDHPFRPDETLPAFLWKSLRGGLLAVVKKSPEQQGR